MTTQTIEAQDIEPGTVFKLDGRWVRLVKWLDPDWTSNDLGLPWWLQPTWTPGWPWSTRS